MTINAGQVSVRELKRLMARSEATSRRLGLIDKLVPVTPLPHGKPCTYGGRELTLGEKLMGVGQLPPPAPIQYKKKRTRQQCSSLKNHRRCCRFQGHSGSHLSHAKGKKKVLIW